MLYVIVKRFNFKLIKIVLDILERYWCWLILKVMALVLVVEKKY